jgi:regulatory protein
MGSVTVTAVERKPRSKLLDVSLGDSSDLRVTPEIALRFALRPGIELSAARLEELRAEQARADAMSAAVRLVSRRARSEKELRERLRQRGVDPSLVDATVGRLKELGLLDDRAFAASWVQGREHSAPRSRRLLVSELRGKGVSGDAAHEAAGVVNEPEAAYRAASKRARGLAGKPFDEFQRKLGDLLLRRGFDYEIAKETVKRLWEEYSSSAGRNGT